ncbi:MAG: hypothetical protein ACTSWN_12805 [Promethearchaeota archaeon]
MSDEYSLDNLFKRLTHDEKKDERIIILQGIAEKILTYLLTTIETTEMRIADLVNGIYNVTSYLSQQQSDFVGRLKQLPGLENLSMPAPPQPISISNKLGSSQEFLDELKSFLKTSVNSFLSSKKAEDVGAGGMTGIVDDATVERVDDSGIDERYKELIEKEKELEKREKYLQKLADELAAKEIQLQEREQTIEIIESGLVDQVKMSAALQMMGIKETTGDLSEQDALAELSEISEKILQGQDVENDQEPSEDEMMQHLLGVEEPEDDTDE